MEEFHLSAVYLSSPPKHRSSGKYLGSSWNWSSLLKWPSWLDWNNFSPNLSDFISRLNLGKTPRLLASVTSSPLVAVVFSTLSRSPTNTTPRHGYSERSQIWPQSSGFLFLFWIREKLRKLPCQGDSWSAYFEPIQWNCSGIQMTTSSGFLSFLFCIRIVFIQQPKLRHPLDRVCRVDSWTYHFQPIGFLIMLIMRPRPLAADFDEWSFLQFLSCRFLIMLIMRPRPLAAEIDENIGY